MKPISIEKSENYELDNVKRAIFKAIAQLNHPDDIIRKREKVLLKINNMGPHPPEKSATTHPAVVEAIINFVLQKKAVPFVCDGPITIPEKKPFMVSGIEEVCSRKGVSLINFNSPKIEYIDVSIIGGGSSTKSLSQK